MTIETFSEPIETNADALAKACADAGLEMAGNQSEPEHDSLAPAAPSVTAEELFRKAVCMSVSLNKPGLMRTGDLDLVGTDADRKRLRLRKLLVQCDEYDEICTLDGRIRRFMKKHSYKSNLRSGIYLVPLAELEEIDTEVQKLFVERTVLVGRFLNVYPAEVESARSALNSQFREKDYPSQEQLASEFSTAIEYIEWGVPGQVATISQSIYHRAQQNAETRLMRATEEIRLAVRQAMLGFVDNIRNKLTPGEDGKRKRFTRAALENLGEFLDHFANRNLTNDGELATLVEEARGLVEGKEVDHFKTDSGALREAFESLTDRLQEMVELAPVREFRVRPGAPVTATTESGPGVAETIAE